MNADTLLSQVKQQGALPATNNLTDAIILDAINTEQRSIVAMLLEQTREEYFTDSEDVALVASKASYTFPERAIGNTARVLKYVDSSGAEDPKALQMFALSDIGDFAYLSSNPIGYYLRATEWCPIPLPGTGTTGSIRVYHARRPSDLVLDAVVAAQHTAVGTIASVTATVITLAAAHNGFPANQKIDIQAAKSPFKLLAKDVTVTAAAAGTTITVSGVTLTSLGIVAGDYVTLAKAAYIPQLPLEAHDMLRDFAIARCKGEILNLKEQAAAIREAAVKRAAGFLKIAEPRVQENAKAISAWRGWKRRSVT